MRHSAILLVLAFVASIQARDDWSWGQEGSPSASPSSSVSFPSSGNSNPAPSGRSSVSFPTAGDHKLDSSIHIETVRPVNTNVRAPRLIQTIEAPRINVAQTVSSLFAQTHAAPAATETVSSYVDHAAQVAPASSAVQPHLPGAQHKGENRDGKPPGDGQAEGRIFDKLCDIGIGFDCKKGYKGHHKGGGLSVYDVSYVQPIQVVPVGGPIAAVPIQKGYHDKGHDKGHHSLPSYGAPSYSPPAYSAPAYSSYGAPNLGYGAPNLGYGAPNLGYGAPASSYGPPVSSYAAPPVPSYHPPRASYEVGPPAQVVKHVHTHHHVYGNTGGGGYAYRKDNSFSSSGSNNINSHFGTFSDSIKKTGTALPAIPPRDQFLLPSSENSNFLDDCQCVERHYCSSIDVVARSNEGQPLLDARSKKTDILSNDTEESNARHKRDVLSVVVDDVGFTPAANPTGRQFRFNAYTPGVTGCSRGHVCCRAPVFRSQRNADSCGRRTSVGLLGRVKNNLFAEGDTEFGEYPWQAAILRREGSDNVYVCGAVLIDARHLLTAAHCINGLNPSDLKVRLGEWDVSSETEFYKHIESPVSGVYSHPEFYSGTLNNDIAILRLFSPVDLSTNPHISPVCLPDQFAVFNGQRCKATGWGKDAFGDNGNFQHSLKEVDVPMVDHTRCENSLRRTRLGSQFNLHKGMICAGGEEGKDACEGDGGSPLVCRGQDGTFQLAGLVSWGVGCGQRGVPGVYTNIPHYLNWIRTYTRV